MLSDCSIMRASRRWRRGERDRLRCRRRERDVFSLIRADVRRVGDGWGTGASNWSCTDGGGDAVATRQYTIERLGAMTRRAETGRSETRHRRGTEREAHRQRTTTTHRRQKPPTRSASRARSAPRPRPTRAAWTRRRSRRKRRRARPSSARATPAPRSWKESRSPTRRGC